MAAATVSQLNRQIVRSIEVIMSKVFVEIKDATVINEQRGDYTFSHQMAKLKKSDGDVVTFQVPLPRGHAGYPAGVYELGPESFEVDQYKRLKLSQYGVTLLPYTPPAGRASA